MGSGKEKRVLGIFFGILDACPYVFGCSNILVDSSFSHESGMQLICRAKAQALSLNVFSIPLRFLLAKGSGYNDQMDWLKLFDKPKDIILKNALQFYLGRYIKRMLELTIDRENKNVRALVELVGEEKPIAVEAHYDIFINEAGDEVRIKANSISVSREWIDLVAQEFIGQEFHIEGKNATRMIKLAKDIGLV